MTDGTEERAERGGGSGMGVAVSVMSSPQLDEESATGLHAYAMRDDVAATSAFLHAEEGQDINARDEYVSKSQATSYCIDFGHFVPRDTRHCIWLLIEGTSPRSSFYSSKAPIKHSK